MESTRTPRHICKELTSSTRQWLPGSAPLPTAKPTLRLPPLCQPPTRRFGTASVLEPTHPAFRRTLTGCDRDTRHLRTCCRDVVHDPWVRQRLRCGESFSVIFDQQIVYEILCFVGHVTPELLRVVKCSSLDCSEELRIVLLIEWRETAK